MVDNQHRKIQGYRDLSQTEIDLMNKIKQKGLELEQLLDDVRDHVKQQRVLSTPPTPEANAEAERLHAAEPERWMAMGKTHFQEGLMSLTRAVAQPTFF